MAKGILYIVATPIGNLEDITLRALQTLKVADLIISEDTRETEKLLTKYEIHKPQISYRDQNHVAVFPRILEALETGLSCALVSDSGTPLISDPGFKLVAECAERGFNITSVPGPSAVTAALSVAGIPSDKYVFLGFLPKTEGKLKKILQDYGDLECTLTIYESPYRVVKLLKFILETLGDRYVTVCNDLTKLHEKIVRGRVSDVLNGMGGRVPKGEFVILVAKKGFKDGTNHT